MKFNKIVMIVTVCIFVLLSGGMYYLSHTENQEDVQIVSEVSVTEEDCQEEQDIQDGKSKKKSDTIFVHVCGAVKKPGVYELPQDARVCDAIKAASGLKKKAADTAINQAQPLADGEQVCIPYRESGQESTDTVNSAAGTGSQRQKISINQATAEELTSLPGIGESKAQSIIQYREEHGGFQKIEDLKKIQGIKDGVFNKIADYIVL